MRILNGSKKWVWVRGCGVYKGQRRSPTVLSLAAEQQRVQGRGRVKSKNDSFPKGSVQAIGKHATGGFKARTVKARCPQ